MASGLSANEYSTPACSPTKSRSLPGERAMSKGCSNFRFGNARTTLKGGGGSGEPMTRDVVQGARVSFAGSGSLGLGGSAADWGAPRNESGHDGERQDQYGGIQAAPTSGA